jgi:hypothetical protein
MKTAEFTTYTDDTDDEIFAKFVKAMKEVGCIVEQDENEHSFTRIVKITRYEIGESKCD